MWNLFGVVGFSEIYARLEEGGGVSLPWVYVHSSICETFSVVVFQRSKLDWREEWGQSAMGRCAFFYMWNIQCSGFPEIYAWLEGGVGSVCHGYMCILLYVKLMQCSGVAYIYGQLLEGVRTVCHGISAFCYTWNLCSVVVLHRSMVDWRRGWGHSDMGICAFFSMWNLFSVVVFQRSMLYWGVHLHRVWPHFSIGYTGLV